MPSRGWSRVSSGPPRGHQILIEGVLYIHVHIHAVCVCVGRGVRVARGACVCAPHHVASVTRAHPSAAGFDFSSHSLGTVSGVTVRC